MDGTSGTTRRHGKHFPPPIINEANPDDFWKFCLYHYNKPQVHNACMTLQEQFKGNVNLALLLAWLESEKFSLSLNALSELIHCTKQSDYLLRRYRILRKGFKDQLTEGGYQKLLNFELLLEKHQQQDLIHCLNQHAWLQSEGSSLSRYCERLSPDAKYLYEDLISRLFSPHDSFHLHIPAKS